MKRIRILGVACLLLAVACSRAPEAPRDAAAPEDAARAGERRFWETYRAATAARTGGDVAAAAAAYDKALQLRPGHGDSLHYLAQLLSARADVGTAREHLLTLTRSEVQSLRGWRQLSLVDGMPALGWRSDLAAAAVAAATAVHLNPGDSGAWALRARWAAYGGDIGGARGYLRESLGRSPNNLEARLLDIWLAGEDADRSRATRTLIAAVAAICVPGATATEGVSPAELSHEDTCPAGHELALAAARLQSRGVETGVDTAARLPALASDASDHARLRTRYAEASLQAWDDPGAEMRAAVDLDGDGAPDLRVTGPSEGSARLLSLDGTPLPGPAIAAWEPQITSGAAAIPWRAVWLRGDSDSRVLIAGGGARPLRLYRPRGELWVETPSHGLPARVFGAVVAAADLDGDGRTDLLVANVPVTAGLRGADPSGLATVLLRGLADGGFEELAALPAGPLAAALAADLDADGDVDLLVARQIETRLAADGHLASAVAPGTAVLALWRNDSGRFVLSTGVVPAIPTTVRDIASVRLSRGTAVYLGTGEMAPELARPDRLWIDSGGVFVDASGALGAGRWGNTVRVAPGPGDGQLTLLRGGLVPGDPPRVSVLTLAR